jgi:hypothetical protein
MSNFLSDLIIPGPHVEVFSRQMMMTISPSHTDEDLKKEFHLIWFLVIAALSKVPDLGKVPGKHIVTMNVYEERIQRLGEGNFCELLRDTVISKDWHSFLKNGILLNSITNKLICHRFQTFFIITHFRIA